MQMIHCYNLCHLLTDSGTFHFLHQFLCSISTSLFFLPCLPPALPSSLPTDSKQRSLQQGSLCLALNLTLSASGSLFLTGAEQAGGMTASCKMKANIVVCLIISPAGVPSGYSKVTFGEDFVLLLKQEVTVDIIHHPRFYC